MSLNKLLVTGAILLVSATVWAQEFPRAEAGLNYSYARYSPSAWNSKGHSLNGGGGVASLTTNLQPVAARSVRRYRDHPTTGTFGSMQFTVH